MELRERVGIVTLRKSANPGKEAVHFARGKRILSGGEKEEGRKTARHLVGEKKGAGNC